MKARIQLVGDRCIHVVFENRIDLTINLQVHKMVQLVKEKNLSGVRDVLPGYNTVVVLFDHEGTSHSVLQRELEDLVHLSVASQANDQEVVTVPVWYDPHVGPDLEDTAQYCGLNPQELIDRHTGSTYPVFMLGFAPGFPYLGQMDPSLAAPRLKEPRTKIPGGSVGIAGEQTGVYPLDSPGGWRIIGQTPLDLFDVHRDQPFLLAPGNLVQFKAISEIEYHRMVKDKNQAKEEGPPKAPIGHDQIENREQDLTKEDPSLLITHGGFSTSIQDLGRQGYLAYGVPRSGAADPISHTYANRLVGNPDGAATLEMTLIGGQFTFQKAVNFAITGAFMHPKLNGSDLPMWSTCQAKPGDKLTFGASVTGMRTYLALEGGIDVPEVLGSRSTYERAGLGGHRGRGLQKGDSLTAMTPCKPLGKERQTVPPGHKPAYGHHWTLCTMAGAQADAFSKEALDTFFQGEYEVSQQLDRMGIRLQGEAIHHLEGPDILSEPIVPGAIQIPGNGQPIIMGVEAQTSGGYTKIGQVCSADLWKLGQIRPGDTLSFVPTKLEEALDLKQATYPLQAAGYTRRFDIRIGSRHYTALVESVDK